MKSKLLINRKLEVLKNRFDVTDDIYQFLSEHTDTLSRIYDHCVQFPQDDLDVFDMEEELYSLVIYMNGKLIYSLDYSTETTEDNIDAFLDSQEDSYFTEVQVNGKLFAFMQGNNILLKSIPSQNMALLNAIQSTPGWLKLIQNGR